MSLFPHDVSCNFCSSCCGQCYRFHFSKGGKEVHGDGISLYPHHPFPTPKEILLLGHISADQMSLIFFFFFCMCPLTAGKNISSNYSPQAHSFCLSPDKGIWNPGCQRGMLKTVEWISLGRGNNSWRTLNQLGMVITRMYIQRHPLGLALHVFRNCFKPRMFSWNNYEMFIAISNSKCRDSFCFGHISLKKKNLRCGYRWEIQWVDGR